MANAIENREMAAKDDWGGVAVDPTPSDDWGGVPVDAAPAADDWGGVPAEPVGLSPKSALDTVISNAGDFARSAPAQVVKSTFDSYAGGQRMAGAYFDAKANEGNTFAPSMLAHIAVHDALHADRGTPQGTEDYRAYMRYRRQLNELAEARAAQPPLETGADATAATGQELSDFYGSDPNSKSAGSQIGRGTGKVISLVPVAAGTGGLGLVAGGLQGAAEAYQGAYTAKAEQMRQAGETDENAINDAAERAGSETAVKTAPTLIAYLAGGKLASSIVGKLIPATSPIWRAVVGGTAATGANAVIGSAGRAIEAPEGQRAQAAMPTLETTTMDTLFGLGMHGLGEYQGAKEAAKNANAVLTGTDPIAAELALRATDNGSTPEDRADAETRLGKMMDEARKVVGQAASQKADELEAAGLPATAAVLKAKAAEAAAPPAVEPPAAETPPVPPIEEKPADDPLHSAESEFLSGKSPAASDSSSSSEPAKSDVGQELPTTPSVEPEKGQEIPKPEDAVPDGIVGVPAQQIPADQIVVRPDLMQFKRADDTKTGVNEAERITGTWDDLKAGTLLLWEPADPSAHGLEGDQRYIVANGHHRFEFGSREGVKGYNTQIIRESDGYSANDARRLGAEINIADNKGTIYDQTKFLRNLRETHGEDEALAVGRRIGARGRKAADIAFSAGDTLFGSFINEKVTPEAAAKIAAAAPGNDAAQVEGIRALHAGKSADWAANIARAHDVLAPAAGATEMNLFGETEFAKIDAIAGRATEVQNELREMIRAVQNAANSPKMAAKMGVDVKDPEGVQKRIEQLRVQIERWNHWPTDPELMGKLKAGTEKDGAIPEPEPSEPKPALSETAKKIVQPDPEMFTGKPDEPFNLVGETKEEAAAKAQAEAERQARIAEADAAQAKEENDKNQGDFFSSKSDAEPSPEQKYLRDIEEAARKAPDELDLLREGKQPGTITFDRPSGGSVTVMNTRASLNGLRARVEPARETGHLAGIVKKAAEVAQNFKGVRVRVLRDESELPANLRDIVGNQTHEEIVDVKNGDVFLFAKNLESPERAAEVIWHAVLGHYGVEKVVAPEEWAGIADSIIAGNDAIARSLGRVYTGESDPAKWTPEQRALVAKEFIARLAEKPAIAPTIWQRIVSAVKAGARALGIKLGYSDADLDRILRQALRKVNRAGGEGEGVFGSIRNATLRGLWDENTELKRFGPYERAKNRLSARGQRTYLEANRIIEETNRAVPDPVRREAVGNYIEAAGEANRTGETRQQVLDRWASTNRAPRYQAGYDAARALTPEEQAFADRAERFYNQKAGVLTSWGILQNVIDSYVSRVWDMQGQTGGALTGGRMKVNPSFARHRSFDTAFEGEQPWVDPLTGATNPGLEHITKDIGEKMAIYSIEANKTLAHRQFIRDISEVRAADGRPAVAPTGNMTRVENDDGALEAHLVYPDSKMNTQTGVDANGDPIEEPTRDYQTIKNKWLMKQWKWLGTGEDGQPVLLQSDLSVHPDYYREVNNITRGSSIREWLNNESTSNAEAIAKLGLRGVEAAQSLAKEAMFSLSGFHYATIAEHVAEHRVNPLPELGRSILNIVTHPIAPLHDMVTRSLNMGPPDYTNPHIAQWMRHGLMIAPDHAAAGSFVGREGEGVGGSSAINRLATRINESVRQMGPKGYPLRPLTETAAFLSRAARVISDDLFHRFIPALKLRLADTVYQRNLQIYRDDIAAGRVTPGSVRYLTASQVNAATSHLNLVDLGRNPTFQHFLSLAVLAPDFTESRGRFVAQAAKGVVSRAGREQMLALAVGSGVIIGTLRVLNQMLDGDPHWELKNLFALIKGNRRYEVRSVQGDVIKMLTDHNAFVQGRVSPIAKFGTEVYTGTNYRGEPVSKMDALGELLTSYIPISARSLPGLRELTKTTRNNPVSPLEQFAGTMGIHSSRYSPISETYRMAKEFKDAHKLGGAPGVYPTSPYQQLRYALEDGDSERAKVEFEKLRAAGQTPDAIDKGFKESMSHPFTDTLAHDADFEKSLNPHDHAIYKLALKRREDVLARYHRIPR
jgi:hypothetical protein